MVMLTDAQTHVAIPYASVWATISKGSKLVYDERLWPMISRYMGPHYGNNVSLPGPGEYKLSLLVSPPEAARHVEYKNVWLKPHRANSTFRLALEVMSDEERVGEKGVGVSAMGSSRRFRLSVPAGRALRRLRLVGAITLISSCALVATAHADGDPGSDVLVYQPLFLASDSGISVSDQVRLGNLLHEADKTGFPLRVAIIAKPDDLGSVTELWKQPQEYAHFLGIELSLAYKGRLLVVMPNGFGFSWPGHSSAAGYRVLTKLSHTVRGESLATATRQAITTLASAGGVHRTEPPTPSKEPSSRSTASSAHPTGAVRSAPASTRILAFVVLALLVAAIVAARFLYGRHRAAVRAAVAQGEKIPLEHRRGSLIVGLCAAGLLVAGVFFIQSPKPTQSPELALAFNPVLDEPARHQLPAHPAGRRPRGVGRAHAAGQRPAGLRVEVHPGAAHRAVHRGEPLPRHAVGRCSSRTTSRSGRRSG